MLHYIDRSIIWFYTLCQTENSNFILKPVMNLEIAIKIEGKQTARTRRYFRRGQLNGKQ